MDGTVQNTQTPAGPETQENGKAIRPKSRWCHACQVEHWGHCSSRCQNCFRFHRSECWDPCAYCNVQDHIITDCTSKARNEGNLGGTRSQQQTIIPSNTTLTLSLPGMTMHFHGVTSVTITSKGVATLTGTLDQTIIHGGGGKHLSSYFFDTKLKLHVFISFLHYAGKLYRYSPRFRQRELPVEAQGKTSEEQTRAPARASPRRYAIGLGALTRSRIDRGAYHRVS